MKYSLSAFLLVSVFTACSDKSNGPVDSRPRLTRANGAIEPTGTPGMTVFLEGSGLAGDVRSRVYFHGENGSPVAAAIASSTNSAIATTVPDGTAASSFIWVETSRGTSDSIPFTITAPSEFDATAITWTATTPLPRQLHDVWAVSMRMTRGPMQGSNLVYAVTSGVDVETHLQLIFVAKAEESGALGQWTSEAGPSVGRHNAGLALATGQNAPIDATVAGYLYLIGGNGDNMGALGDVWFAPVALDGSIGAWQTTTQLPKPMYFMGATIVRGYVYVTGGANHTKVPTSTAYRAPINADGTLGAWTAITPLPKATQMHNLVSSGAMLYVVGGDTGKVANPWEPSRTGTETGAVWVAEIDLRDGSIGQWTPTTSLTTGRIGHATVLAGRTLLTTSGMYSSGAGASESEAAVVSPRGFLGGWTSINATNTIEHVFGSRVSQAAAVSFTTSDGKAHVVVLGPNRLAPWNSLAPVAYY